MRNISPFLAVEICALVMSETANVVEIAPIPWSQRAVVAVVIALFGAMRLLRPRSVRYIRVYLIASAVFLITMAAFSGIAAFLSALLVIRCFELLPGNRKALIAAVASALFAFLLATYTGVHLEHRPSMIAASIWLGCIDVLLILLLVLMNDLRLSQATLASTNTEMAILGERYRIARELHDEVGHQLTAIGVQLEAAQKMRLFDSERADQFVSQARASADTMLAAIRRTVSRLRNEPLVHQDAAEAIKQLESEFMSPGKMHVDFKLSDTAIDDPLTVAGIERIVREALINAVRHSQASSLTVTLDVVGKEIELRIEDDGVGFDPASACGNGLHIMRERVSIMGGSCTIASEPRGGTRIFVTIPVPPLPIETRTPRDSSRSSA